MRLSALVCASTLLGVAACSSAPTPAAPPAPKATFGTFGVDLTAMDSSVKPGDDFYKYVNGTWLNTYKIPADRASYGVGAALQEKAEADVRTLVEELAKQPQPAGSVGAKVVDLYQAWMDEAALEQRGTTPIKADLDGIAAIATKADLMKLLGRPDYAGPVGMYIIPDPADTTRYIVGLTQAGLGMPSRDYYLEADQRFVGYRAAYKTYVTRIFELIGDQTPAASADAVMALETKLARVHWAPERRRDVKATNNPTDRAGLKKMIPAVDWEAVLPVAGLGDVQRFLVNETTALRDGARLLDTEALATWKKYFAFHLASDYATYLTKAFDDASFTFFNKTLSGTEAKRDRWKRGVALINNQIGEGVGELYAARYFPAGHKAGMDALVANLRTAMAERLKALSWMDDATRAEALKKLSTFEPRIGYPSQWRDYSALTIAKGQLFEGVRQSRLFEWNRQVKRLNSPVDRTEWEMTPQTVNAYYHPLMNQITFPAAILQPPFFDPAADPAVNYGAIGAIIGHEIGHGFDDQGREFDEVGKIRNWWTPETNSRFVAQTEKLAAQFAAYCPLPSQCVNGKLTMGENIGDLGGLEMAYSAYKIALGGKDAPVIDGFTGDQRFFLGYAQSWRGLRRDDSLIALLRTDPHSPSAARGGFPVRNMDAWYAAFGVKEGDKAFIAPDQRVRIW